MEKLFLIDSYAFIYRAYYAFINNPRINSKGENISAIMGYMNTLMEIVTKEKPTMLGAAFDPKGPTFRHVSFEQYKAQREAAPEDIHWSAPWVKQLLEAWGIPVFEVDGYEADDVIGTLARQADELGIETYMATGDKDYGQLVTEHVRMYRPMFKGGFETLGIEDVKEKFGLESPSQVIDYLALMGDKADNIPGCKGIGEVTAQKLLKEFGSVEELLSRTNELKGANKTKIENGVEDIRMSKFLATIKTDVPVSLDPEALRYSAPNREKLEPLLDRLELRSLKTRLFSTKTATPPTSPQGRLKPANQELDLFAEPVQQSDLFAEAVETAVEFKTERITSLDELNKLIKQSYHNAPSPQPSPEGEGVETYSKTNSFSPLGENERGVIGLIALSIETTVESVIDAEIKSINIAVDGETAYTLPVELLSALAENESLCIASHNTKRDIILLRKLGITPKCRLFDTQIAHYVLQPEQNHTLARLAEVLLGISIIDYRLSSPVIFKLAERLSCELDEKGMRRLFDEIEMPLVPVLAEMEYNGVRISTESLAETSRELNSRLAGLEARIYELAGCQFNIASPKQVGEVLFDKLRIMEKPKKTKTGQYVTSEEVLQQLAHHHEIVGLILEHRGLKKLLGTYVDALPSLINPKTGHIHTTFNQTVTATGRLSSSDPNLQNIPIRGEDGKEIRRAFVPEPGCLFFSADYSQIELRVMAHLSKDENMIDAFKNERDVHATTAANIYGKSIDEVTRDERTKAKRANFGIIYGITTFGLAERLDIPRDEAKQLIEGYFATFPQVHDYMERAKEKARSRGYVETLLGRRRYLPDINSRNATVRGFAERNAINAPIQGTAADIIKIAMIRIFQRFMATGIKSKMILQVHDELNFSVLPEEQDKVRNIVIEEMSHAIQLAVPLTADSGFGANWLEAH